MNNNRAIFDIKNHISKFHFSCRLSYDEGDLGLDETYIQFYKQAQIFLGKRIFKDYILRFAYGLDASCYRYIPKLVVWAQNEEEIQRLFAF